MRQSNALRVIVKTLEILSYSPPVEVLFGMPTGVITKREFRRQFFRWLMAIEKWRSKLRFSNWQMIQNVACIMNVLEIRFHFWNKRWKSSGISLKYSCWKTRIKEFLIWSILCQKWHLLFKVIQKKCRSLVFRDM